MYFPLTKTHSNHWGVDLSSWTYSSNTITPTPSGPPITGVVDTGSPSVFALYACRDTDLFSCQTAILIPDDLFHIYMDTITRAKFDKRTTGLIEFPSASIEHMQPFHFTIGNREFTLDINLQLLP